MIREAIDLLDRDAWRAADPVPRSEPLVTPKVVAKLRKAFARRQSRVADLVGKLAALDLPRRAADDLPLEAGDFIDTAINELHRRTLQNEEAIQREIDAGSPAHSIWFYCVDQPDRDVASVMYTARSALGAI